MLRATSGIRLAPTRVAVGSVTFAVQFVVHVVVQMMLAAGNASAQSAAPSAACATPPARAVSVQGTVEIKRASASDWQPVRLNDSLCPGDTIRVQDRSRADVALLNQSMLRLNANSTVVIEAPK